MRVRDLSTPRQRRRVGIHYDQDAFGQFSEAIARRLGTARFLVLQSVIVFVWLRQVPVHLAHVGAITAGCVCGAAHPACAEPARRPRPGTA